MNTNFSSLGPFLPRQNCGSANDHDHDGNDHDVDHDVDHDNHHRAEREKGSGNLFSLELI